MSRRDFSRCRMLMLKACGRARYNGRRWQIAPIVRHSLRESVPNGCAASALAGRIVSGAKWVALSKPDEPPDNQGRVVSLSG